MLLEGDDGQKCVGGEACTWWELVQTCTSAVCATYEIPIATAIPYHNLRCEPTQAYYCSDLGSGIAVGSSFWDALGQNPFPSLFHLQRFPGSLTCSPCPCAKPAWLPRHSKSNTDDPLFPSSKDALLQWAHLDGPGKPYLRSSSRAASPRLWLSFSSPKWHNLFRHSGD